MSIRRAHVAGTFYPASIEEIEKIFKESFKVEEEKIKKSLAEKNIVGGVSPHAGYIYCAREAVHLFQILKEKQEKYDTIIIINPNHTGYGEKVSIDSNDYWETPFGKVEVDKELKEIITFAKENSAQMFEHSGEVMLPYLQYFLGAGFKILPICMMRQDLKTAKDMAVEIRGAVQKLGRKVLVLISSDFTHFKSPKEGAELDDYALEPLLRLDTEEFQRRVCERDISICGAGPIMVLMEYSKLILKNPKAEVLRRGHSGEECPASEVVDYVSLLFYED